MAEYKAQRFSSFMIGLAIMVSGSCALAAVGKVSRSCAPFGAQESITVDWTFTPHQLWTASQHYRNGAFFIQPILQSARVISVVGKPPGVPMPAILEANFGMVS